MVAPQLPPGLRLSSASSDDGHPIHRAHTTTTTISLGPTHFFLQPFSQRHLLVVSTDRGSGSHRLAGTVVEANRETTLDGAVTYAVRTVLGTRERGEGWELVARWAAEKWGAVLVFGCGRGTVGVREAREVWEVVA
eukprot:CAMPEP_0198346986 /NCGR_PEP_ID=MMETSP1450-20131203/82581_1 /TAXON_ID=753684 ORGANISM="Madagascaria erythrocladiodes, Strain CCMP3234" /NCGR_SAMPLE_ID=MMETSP1450 /ASSEMBLY_ACC=CAM_ASM_001115 /LENGTH=135 /DNA_ID=CAMNT_0044052469 /DNA_START=25 /DNA_END=428 /DNA_ORIENTATION=-